MIFLIHDHRFDVIWVTVVTVKLNKTNIRPSVPHHFSLKGEKDKRFPHSLLPLLISSKSPKYYELSSLWLWIQAFQNLILLESSNFIVRVANTFNCFPWSFTSFIFKKMSTEYPSQKNHSLSASHPFKWNEFLHQKQLIQAQFKWLCKHFPLRQIHCIKLCSRSAFCILRLHRIF